MEAIVKNGGSGRLTGRRALITGAARGIGAATAARMRAEGAEVTVVDITAGDGVVGADVTDPDGMARAVAIAAGDGRLDICVANAGIFSTAPLVEAELPAWQKIIDVNLVGVAVTFQAAARRMIADGGGGRLAAMSSIAAWKSMPGGTAYCASKAAVIGLVRCFAAEVGPHGITVNAVAPGEIDTEMNDDFIAGLAEREGTTVEAIRKGMTDSIPLRAMGQPADVASVLTFLASDDAAYLTGQVISIDGGVSVT